MLRNFESHPLLLVVLIVLVVVVFGAKRLPDAARSLGRSARIFKSEIKEMKEDGKPGGASPAGSPSRPLEGKVVDAGDVRTEPRPEQTRSEAPTDAQRDSA